MDLDEWQEEVLGTSGNICLRSGRQVGKSTIIARKAALYALRHPLTTVMVVASVERQALLLFEKILSEIYDEDKTQIRKGKDKPTKHKITLKNGSKIYSLPTGLSGYGIRGYTIDLLIADEAAFIPEEVWTAITPMLAVTQGDIILLSTPFGKEGYFYRAFNDKTFTSFHVSSEDCPRIDPVFLKNEKTRMTEIQYAQEYLGEFVDELLSFFSEELIRSCIEVGVSNHSPSPLFPRYMGVDVARMGSDETVLASFYDRDEVLVQFGMEITRKTLLTDTVNLVLTLDERYKYKKIYIDDGGLGVGVFDPLLTCPQTRRKVVAINNSSRAITSNKKRRKKLLKEDLYNNLKNLMEKGKIRFFNDDRTIMSLRSIQAEYKNGNLLIYGRYSHIAEAMIRAAWSQREKGLKVWIR